MTFKPGIHVSGDDYLKTYNVMRVGDIAFEGHKSKDFSHGRFVANTIGDGIVSHIFDVYMPIGEYSLLFWKYLINNDAVMQPILINSTTDARMMCNLVTGDFFNQSISVPCLEEQQKIGAFLQNVDETIVLHQRLHSQCL